ncbi:hypothetical protein MNBD_GAMMA22-1888 [hydrothermal vent metagenome]|uniref:DUF1178 domain-containing protein n=1 Tax=hydrothermal vent metagenome TaxID=652676 RepID=A0A3B1APL1_9ZZZZ
MIIFDLMCELEHRFEGWFKKSADFDTQLMNGQLTCPICGINEILKLNDSNNANNVIEIKPYKLLKEKLNKSELVLDTAEVDVNALTSEFIERLNDFVEQHFDDLDVNISAEVRSLDSSNIISSKVEQEEVKILDDSSSILTTSRPKKNKKLN